MSAAVGVAVVGTGYWGPNLVRNLAALPAARLVAVCDRDVDRLKALTLGPDVVTATRLEDLVARPDVHAVCIATPAETHFALARQCLEAGKHVYVEKPLTTCATDARVLAALAERAGRILMVGHLFLYEPATRRLIELARAGAIGELRYSSGVRVSMSGTARLDTTIIWDALIHDAYIQPQLFDGAPSRVQVVGGAYLRPGGADVAFATFDFGGGRLFHTTVSWYGLAKQRTLLVVGSDGMLAYDSAASTPLLRYDRRYVPSDRVDALGRRYWRWHEGEGEPVVVPTAEPLREECAHFLSCIAEGRSPRTDARAGADVVEIMEACARSADRGGEWEPVIAREQRP